MDSIQRKDDRKSITHIEYSIYCVKNIDEHNIWEYNITEVIIFSVYMQKTKFRSGVGWK